MAEVDFTELTGSLADTVVDRGVTAGIAPPPGGGTFVFGYNSLSAAVGAVGFFTNQVNFAPMPKGGRVQAAFKRGVGAGKTNFSPMLFIGLQGPAVTDEGYLVGLSDADPSHIILRKGKPSEGLPETLGQNGVFAVGSTPITDDTYVHVRLDVIVNLNGDVVLTVQESDLDTNDVVVPVFADVPGIAQIIDDALGIKSADVGSTILQPFETGRAGMAFEVSDITRRAFFDHIEIARQL